MLHSKSKFHGFYAFPFFTMLFVIGLGMAWNVDPVPTPEHSMSFAAFTDTHVGQRTQNNKWGYADYLDRLADDIMDNTLPCEFVVHLGDGANDNTAFVNGVGLPKTMDPSKNNFKAFLVSHLNLPFHYVGGNIDLNDYSDGPDLPQNDKDPFALLKTYVNETELNTYPYAMMRNGILFLALPEMEYEPWTRPAEYEWVEFMTTYYHNATTIIFSHQAIEDTTPHDGDPMSSYRGQQDEAWWARLLQNNPQIKMWIHGHNHMPGWYVGSQSSGWSRPVQNFGHEMAFSAPYPQMDWANYVEEDTIVIYTISSTGVTTKAWENNGAGGHWVAGCDMTWKVPTTYNTTEDFRMSLSGKSYAVAGKLGRFKTKDFSINPVDLADPDGIIKFTASIKGNHYGMARLIYHAPLLMGRNARYKVNSVKGNAYDITLTGKLSGYSNIFNMFPFSTKYGGVAIRADDGSGESHTSKNKNQWITSDCSETGKRVLITYPTPAPPR